MKLTILTPQKSLNKAYLKQSLKRDQIELFRTNLVRLFERIRTDEHEEHLKNIVSDFLKDTWYKQTHEINTSGRGREWGATDVTEPMLAQGNGFGDPNR